MKVGCRWCSFSKGWLFQVLRFLNIENGGCSWFCRFQSITFDCSEDSVPGVWLLKPSKKEGLDPQKLEGWRDLHGPLGFEIAMILRVGEIFEKILNVQQNAKEWVGSLSQQRISYDSEEIPVEKQHLTPHRIHVCYIYLHLKKFLW